MKPNRSNSTRLGHRLAVAWSDSVWFPPVQPRGRSSALPARPQVQWACQIITDPTVCRARTVNPA